MERKKEADMKTMKEPRSVLRDGWLYIGDNGRMLCGRHSGMSARYTGRDISGQKVARVKAEEVAAYCAETGEDPSIFACEDCGRRP